MELGSKLKEIRGSHGIKKADMQRKGLIGNIADKVENNNNVTIETLENYVNVLNKCLNEPHEDFSHYEISVIRKKYENS